MFERNVDLSNRFQQSLLFCDWKENNNNNDNQKTKGTATQRTKSRVDEWTSSAPEIKLPPPRLTPTFLGTSANHINVCQTLLSSFPLESFYSAWPHQSLSPVPPPLPHTPQMCQSTTTTLPLLPPSVGPKSGRFLPAVGRTEVKVGADDDDDDVTARAVLCRL